jgi:HD-GYP domain-containing protein (c-di-GMP phosphodiesterase class II)
MGLNEDVRQAAELGALLHDIGKIAIPDEIINKPGPLDADEWVVMQTHTIEGQRMLDQVGGLLGDVGVVVRASHERWDGGGYPDGLAGAAIPLAARIVSACDAYNAMTTDRSYRKALPLEVAARELRSNAGTQFDPAVVDALLGVVGAPAEPLSWETVLGASPAAAAPGPVLSRPPARSGPQPVQ